MVASWGRRLLAIRMEAALGIEPVHFTLDATVVPLADVPAGSWDGLAAHHATPLTSSLWVQTAAEVMAGNESAQAVVVGDPSAPTAAAALYIPPDAPEGYRLLGALDFGESVDLPARDDAALALLAEQLWHLGRPVDLGHLPIDTKLLSHLKRHRPPGSVLLALPRATKAMPVINLDRDWGDPARALGRKRRQSLARKKRQAAKSFGPVSTRVLAPDSRQVRALIDQAYAVEANSWKSRVGTALRQQPHQADFFRRFGQRAAERGLFRVAFLDFGGTTAAMQFGVEVDDVFWSIRIGYDERFSSVSPGELLMYDLICDGAERGLSRIELCGKAAEWTRRWTDTARPIASVRLYPATVLGVRGFARDAVTHSLRRVRDRITDAGGAP